MIVSFEVAVKAEVGCIAGGVPPPRPYPPPFIWLPFSESKRLYFTTYGTIVGHKSCMANEVTLLQGNFTPTLHLATNVVFTVNSDSRLGHV